VSARILDGRAVAAEIREAVLPEVHAFTSRSGRPPGLGIVLVGDDPSSEIYVRNKIRAGSDSGLWVDLQRLPCAFHGLRAAGFERLVLLGPSLDEVTALAEPQGWRPVPGSKVGVTVVVEAAATSPATPPICPPGPGG